MNKRLKSYKGITLIALVITIIVLLILAGVSIAMLTGENGILNRAVSAREEASHAEVKEQVLLAIAEYELEKKTPEGSEAATIIDYLGQNGYLTEYDSENPKESYVIPKAKLGEATLGKGTSKETGDVYVIEKANLKAANITKLASTQEVGIKIAEESTDNNWALKYYKTSNDENPKVLLNFPISKNSSPSKPKQIATNTSELVVGDYVDYVYKNSDGKNVKIPCRVLYDTSYNSQNETDFGVQLVSCSVTEEKHEISTGVYGTYWTYYFEEFDLDKYLNDSISDLVRFLGSDPITGDPIILHERKIDDVSDCSQLVASNCLDSQNSSYWLMMELDSSYENGDYCLVFFVEDNKIDYVRAGDTWNDEFACPQSLGEKGFRLCFKLKDELPIISGTGEKETPYQLVETE